MDFCSNIKIRSKLLIMLVPSLLGIFVLGYSNFFDQISATKTIKAVHDTNLVRMSHSHQLKFAAAQIQQRLTDISTSQEQDKLDNSFEVADAWAMVFNRSLDELIRLDSKNSHQLRSLRHPFGNYYETGKKMVRAYADGGPQAENQATAEFDSASEQLLTMVDRYVAIIESELGASLSNVTDEIAASAANTVWIAVITLLLSLSAVFLIGNQVTSRLGRLEKEAEEIATGRLVSDRRLHGRDEIGNASRSLDNIRKYFISIRDVANKLAQNDFSFDFKPCSDVDEVGHRLVSMTKELNKTFATMLSEISSLLETSKELSTVSTDLAKGATAQIDDTNQVSSAVEQITVTIAQSSENAYDASKLSNDAAEAANLGNQVVAQTIEGMNRIAEVVQGSATTIQSLSSSSDRIGSIVSVINDIADQTNLLALNAAIEAARAGEQGRGFAVVADEVRKLAERTTSATDEITGMITSIQSETKSAVDSVQKGIEEVEAGKELTDKAGDSLRSIAEYSSRVQEMIQQIATASAEEAAASEGIAKSVDRIAAVSLSTASGAERSAAVATEFSIQSDHLRGLVQSFKLKKSTVDEIAASDNHLLIGWNDRFVLGLPDIDRQHKRLVDLINGLHLAMTERKGASVVGEILEGLVDYTKTHFSYEENKMKEAGYPTLDSHKEIHDKLVAQVVDFQNQFKSGKAIVSNDIMQFLKDWLLDHILKNDKQYVPYMNKAKV